MVIRLNFLIIVSLLFGFLMPTFSDAGPRVAIGYDYSVAPGDPNFAAFIPPTIGDTLYDLYLFNGTEYIFKAQVTGGTPYIFDPGGVDRFRLLGIEDSAGIDPNNREAFGTLLAWVKECDCIEIEHGIIETVFSDLPIGHWADDAIMAIYDAGITKGCSQNPLKYCPEDKVTREEMAVFITRALNQVPADGYCGTTNPFPDIAFDRWSCKNIKRLAEMGIATGYGDGRFGPDDFVTREQMAVFLTRALDVVPAEGYCGVTNPFFDVVYDRWSCKSIKRLYELGIATGYRDGRFGPEGYVTRDQMAVFLSRALGVQEQQIECSTTGYCGPAGGELSVTNPSSCAYGVRIVIPPGALDVVGEERRSLWIVDNPNYGLAPSLPPGFIAYPNRFNPCGIALDTGGDRPYNVGLYFYFPVQGMTIGPGEIPCAFAYDERVGKWRILLPESIDGSTMRVKANYRMVWKWGKMALKEVEEEYLVQAIEEKYGADTWTAILARIDEFTNLNGQQVERNCASLINLRDGFLEFWKQSFRQRLLEYQPQFAVCGTCDVLSEQFAEDIKTFISNRFEIEMWELLGMWADSTGGRGVLAKLYCEFKILEAWWEIRHLGCSPTCVTEKGGIDFWVDYASYYVGVFGQQLINLSIEIGWVTCP